MEAACVRSARNLLEIIKREGDRKARRETKIKWRKEMEKSYLQQADRGTFVLWPLSRACTHESMCLHRHILCMCVVFIAVCLYVSVSLDDLWFVFTLPYFGPACRHWRMNDKLRTSIGLTLAPVVPRCPPAQRQESSSDKYIRKIHQQKHFLRGRMPNSLHFTWKLSFHCITIDLWPLVKKNCR